MRKATILVLAVVLSLLAMQAGATCVICDNVCLTVEDPGYYQCDGFPGQGCIAFGAGCPGRYGEPPVCCDHQS